jgi:uncharacterized protein (DUF1778 family)
MTKAVEERLSETISIRIPKHIKQIFQREATAQGQNLSEFLFDCISKGFEVVKTRAKGQK